MTGGHRLCEPETDLELNDANRLQLFDDKSSAKERQLRGQFTDFDWWPADAQLGLMAMAWGLGAGFPSRWSKFSAACKKKDFDAQRLIRRSRRGTLTGMTRARDCSRMRRAF
jgi:hypothetical protein